MPNGIIARVRLIISAAGQIRHTPILPLPIICSRAMQNTDMLMKTLAVSAAAVSEQTADIIRVATVTPAASVRAFFVQIAAANVWAATAYPAAEV